MCYVKNALAKLSGNDINGHTHFRFTYSVLYLELIWFDLLSAIILGDIVIKEGTIGTKMYFIQEGIVDIVLSGEIFVSFNLFSNFDFVFSGGEVRVGQGVTSFSRIRNRLYTFTIRT